MGKLLGKGVKAPEFSLPRIDGGMTSLGEMLAGGPVVLAFFKISCPVCQLTLPFLERLKDNGAIQIVGVSQDTAENTRHFQKHFGVTLAAVIDDGAKDYPVTRAYGLTHVPTLFEIETNGEISKVTTGFSKADLAALGERAGRVMFTEADKVPELKPG